MALRECHSQILSSGLPVTEMSAKAKSTSGGSKSIKVQWLICGLGTMAGLVIYQKLRSPDHLKYFSALLRVRCSQSLFSSTASPIRTKLCSKSGGSTRRNVSLPTATNSSTSSVAQVPTSLTYLGQINGPPATPTSATSK
jgi:hypothetical protein